MRLLFVLPLPSLAGARIRKSVRSGGLRQHRSPNGLFRWGPGSKKRIVCHAPCTFFFPGRHCCRERVAPSTQAGSCPVHQTGLCDLHLRLRELTNPHPPQLETRYARHHRSKKRSVAAAHGYIPSFFCICVNLFPFTGAGKVVGDFMTGNFKGKDLFTSKYWSALGAKNPKCLHHIFNKS